MPVCCAQKTMSRTFIDFASELAGQILSDGPLYADLKSGVFLFTAVAEIAENTLPGYLRDAFLARGAEVIRIGGAKLSGQPTLEIIKELCAGAPDNLDASRDYSLHDIVRGRVSEDSVLVILIDQVDEFAFSEEGIRVLKALKACRDGINRSPYEHGTFIAAGTGTSRTSLQTMTGDPTSAFYGAALIDVPLQT